MIHMAPWLRIQQPLAVFNCMLVFAQLAVNKGQVLQRSGVLRFGFEDLLVALRG